MTKTTEAFKRLLAEVVKTAVFHSHHRMEYCSTCSASVNCLIDEFSKLESERDELKKELETLNKRLDDIADLTVGETP